MKAFLQNSYFVHYFFYVNTKCLYLSNVTWKFRVLLLLCAPYSIFGMRGDVLSSPTLFEKIILLFLCRFSYTSVSIYSLVGLVRFFRVCIFIRESKCVVSIIHFDISGGIFDCCHIKHSYEGFMCC